jgi:hypothetical protein
MKETIISQTFCLLKGSCMDRSKTIINTIINTWSTKANDPYSTEQSDNVAKLLKAGFYV